MPSEELLFTSDCTSCPFGLKNSSEPEVIIDRLQSASSTCNAWLWRIGTSLNSLESVSDEQWVLYSAVDTVYQTYTGLLDELENDLLSGNDAAASQLYYAKVVPCGDYLSQYTLQLLETAIQDSQTTYTTISALNERITMLRTKKRLVYCKRKDCVSGRSRSLWLENLIKYGS